MSYQFGLLSGSTNGKRILVAQTATPGTLIHTATPLSEEYNYDLIYLWAENLEESTTRTLVLEWGESADPGLIYVPILAKAGLFPIVPGFPLQNGLSVRAFCTTANKIAIAGYIHKARA